MSNSDDSDVSSSISSDGEVLMALGKDYGNSSSSDDSEAGQESTVPHALISSDEQTEITAVLSSGMEKPNFQIFPRTVGEYLTQKNPNVVNQLRELPGRDHSVAIATRSLLIMIDGKATVKQTPKSVLFDVCVISPTEPVLVLTITSDYDKTTKLLTYNSEITRRFVEAVRGKTKYSFSAVCGVVEESQCQSSNTFREKIDQLKRNADVKSIPPALVMTQNKCLNILQPILQLLPVDVPVDQPQASGAVKQEDVLNIFYSIMKWIWNKLTNLGNHFHVFQEEDESAISQKDFRAIIARMKQLELEQKEMKAGIKKERAEHKKERSELTEKCDLVMKKLERIQQDYLEDTRLTLLMRPRSSSISETITSGFCSTEAQEALGQEEISDIERQQEKEGDGEESNGKPQLTTEAVKTRDLELVQYNRDVTLHQACSEGKLDVVKYILFKGISGINCRGKYERTPIMTAVEHEQVAIFDFLVSQGSDLSAVDHINQNVLHYACKTGIIDIVRKLLVIKKYDIESRGCTGKTPVLYAAMKGKKEVFDFLVNRGSDLTVVDNDKDTILHLACIGGNVDIVKYILSHKIVDIESRGMLGRTPVMKAVWWGRKQVFDFLVSRRSDLKKVDDCKDTILHFACFDGTIEIVQNILSRNIVDIESRGNKERTAVMVAAYNGNNQSFDVLVGRGSDLKVVDNNKDTILHVACYGGNVDIVKYILSHKIVDIESRGLGGRTSVMTAVAQGRKEVFELLLGKGSKITALLDDGNTILHVACLRYNSDMAEYLLTLPAVQGMEKVKNKHGETPVQLAERKGHTAVISLLKAKK